MESGQFVVFWKIMTLNHVVKGLKLLLQIFCVCFSWAWLTSTKSYPQEHTKSVCLTKRVMPGSERLEDDGNQLCFGLHKFFYCIGINFCSWCLGMWASTMFSSSANAGDSSTGKVNLVHWRHEEVELHHTWHIAFGLGFISVKCE